MPPRARAAADAQEPRRPPEPPEDNLSGLRNTLLDALRDPRYRPELTAPTDCAEPLAPTSPLLAICYLHLAEISYIQATMLKNEGSRLTITT